MVTIHCTTKLSQIKFYATTLKTPQTVTSGLSLGRVKNSANMVTFIFSSGSCLNNHCFPRTYISTSIYTSDGLSLIASEKKEKNIIN